MLVSFALGDANFSRFYPTRNLKVAFYPTRNPNASQWNIGCVGCQRKIFVSGMYISCFLCRFHLHRAPNANPFLGGIWALQYGKFNWIQIGVHSTNSTYIQTSSGLTSLNGENQIEKWVAV